MPPSARRQPARPAYADGGAEPAGDSVLFNDSAGVEHRVPLTTPSSASRAARDIIRCCDPYNEKVYELPLPFIDRTAGRDSYLSNRSGRRAQVCMKYQQGRCNMKERCQQVHAEPGLIAALRELYIGSRKHYVSEITCYEPPEAAAWGGVDGTVGGTLTFRYSDVEPTAGRERYRTAPEGQRHFALCAAFVSEGRCADGRRCAGIHVPRDRYMKAKRERYLPAVQGQTQQQPAARSPPDLRFPTVESAVPAPSPARDAAPAPATGGRTPPPFAAAQPPSPRGHAAPAGVVAPSATAFTPVIPAPGTCVLLLPQPYGAVVPAAAALCVAPPPPPPPPGTGPGARGMPCDVALTPQQPAPQLRCGDGAPQPQRPLYDRPAEAAGAPLASSSPWAAGERARGSRVPLYQQQQQEEEGQRELRQYSDQYSDQYADPCVEEAAERRPLFERVRGLVTP